jgi:hypothetical protein
MSNIMMVLNLVKQPIQYRIPQKEHIFSNYIFGAGRLSQQCLWHSMQL